MLSNDQIMLLEWISKRSTPVTLQQMSKLNPPGFSEQRIAELKQWDFVTACYTALAQIHDHMIQVELLDLLTYIRENNGKVNENTNQKFDQIMLSISNYLEKSSK